MSAGRGLWPDIHSCLGVSGRRARGETTTCREDTQWEWRARYCPRAARQSDHGERGIKKKAAALSPGNTGVVEGCCPEASRVEGRRVAAAEVDEMWSFGGRKAQQRGLGHAIDHLPGGGLAYVVGTRAEEVFWQLQKLLKPFGLGHFDPDAAGVSDRGRPAAAHTVGKRHPQQIERKHLRLRTRLKRLARQTSCFSKSVLMHATVIGLFVNRYEFGTPV